MSLVGNPEERKRMDDRVEEWHNLPDTDPSAALSLHEFLGLTWAEYCECTFGPGLVGNQPAQEAK